MPIYQEDNRVSTNRAATTIEKPRGTTSRASTIQKPHETTKLLPTSDTEDDDREAVDDDDDEEEQFLRLAGYSPVDGTPQPPPIKMPEFSLKELRAAVPKHCFERSLVTSTSYLLKDLFTVSALFYGAYRFHLSEPSLASQMFFWPMYTVIQAACMGAVWIIGHECGHQAFSVYCWINDLVGFVLHSALLTPYFSWKITHRQHHAKANSMEHDSVFVPMTRTEYKTWHEAVEDNLEDAPLFNLYRVCVVGTIGLIQDFLGKLHLHFNPSSEWYADRENHLIMVSNIGVTFAFVGIARVTWALSLAAVTRLFFVPYIVMNVYIVILTLLQHTDTFIPRFREGSWKWLHASLCTVDRDLGVFINDVLHHGPDTHVCHHIFSKIPHYHAVEATRALQPLLGRYYLKDRTPIITAFWRQYTQCRYVEDDGSVVFIKKSV